MLLGILVLSVGLLGVTEAGGSMCPDGQVYMECGSACNITCDDRDTNFIKPCTLQCVPRCQCPSDKPVQDITFDGRIRCITGDMCCPKGKVWNDCAPSCPPECNPEPKVCTLECQFRCTCPRDRPIETSDGQCISEEQCPLDCPKPYVFMECGSACNRTCEDPNPICTRQCVRRCQCPHNRPIQHGNNCVTEDFCRFKPEVSNTCLDCMCAIQSTLDVKNQEPGCKMGPWFTGKCDPPHPQVTGCVMDRQHCRCGPYLITEQQFLDCKELTELPFDDFHACAANNDCTRQCLKAYMGEFALSCTGKQKAEEVTCKDFARMLYGGKEGCKKRKTQQFGNSVAKCAGEIE